MRFAFGLVLAILVALSPSTVDAQCRTVITQAANPVIVQKNAAVVVEKAVVAAPLVRRVTTVEEFPLYSAGYVNSYVEADYLRASRVAIQPHYAPSCPTCETPAKAAAKDDRFASLESKLDKLIDVLSANAARAPVAAASVGNKGKQLAVQKCAKCHSQSAAASEGGRFVLFLDDGSVNPALTVSALIVGPKSVKQQAKQGLMPKKSASLTDDEYDEFEQWLDGLVASKTK